MIRIGTMIVALAVAGVPMMTGCQSTQVQSAAKSDITYHTYAYYPQSQVYFDADAATYYWNSGKGWQAGPVLPITFNIENERSVALHLSTKNPYERHAEISAIYPPENHFAAEDH